MNNKNIITEISKKIKYKIDSSHSTKKIINNIVHNIKESKTKLNVRDIIVKRYNISLDERVPISSFITIDNPYLSSNIHNYIYSQGDYYYTYDYIYKTRVFRLYFVIFKDFPIDFNDLQKLVFAMLRWFIIIIDSQPLKKRCGERTDVYCYLTPFKKELPDFNSRSNTITYDNANSAITTSCIKTNEICIFRYEEIFKVFIHETFHSFDLDFSYMDEEILRILKEKISKIYFIKSEFNLYETYSEIWAELMNILFIYVDKYNRLSYKFLEQLIKEQVIFSLLQTSKILLHYGLDYNDIISNKGSILKYKENTNVFSYYILKSLIIYYWSDFLEWCYENNKVSTLKFTSTKKNLNDFYLFIERIYNSTDYLYSIDKVFEYVSNECNTIKCGNNLLMTIHEYI